MISMEGLSVAQQVSMNYLSVPKGERLIARSQCVKSGKSTSVINVNVSDDTGRLVEQFVETAFRL